MMSAFSRKVDEILETTVSLLDIHMTCLFKYVVCDDTTDVSASIEQSHVVLFDSVRGLEQRHHDFVSVRRLTALHAKPVVEFGGRSHPDMPTHKSRLGDRNQAVKMGLMGSLEKFNDLLVWHMIY